MMKTQDATWILNVVILILIGIVAIGSRLFSVIRYESIIHEFDPWFNYRATQYLVREGYYAFLNWFDETAWYPLGRVVGGTVFPGLMVTAALIEKVLREWLLIPVDIRHICVFMAPAFSALTAFSTYGLTRIAMEGQQGAESAGLFGAMFVAIAPGYISRSVAGSYDNEAIAIPLLMITFYLWLKSLTLGSPMYGLVCGLSYFYMVSAWGGYVFIINLIPLHVFVLLLMGRYTDRLYKSYSTFYVIGTMSSMLVPFVGVNPSRTSDHMAALGTFGLLQIVGLIVLLKGNLSSHHFRAVLGWLFIALISLLALLVFIFPGDLIAPWTGRFWSLWDTDYAKNNLPIVASVSEHQPTTWASFFFDLQFLVVLFPVGIYQLFMAGSGDSDSKYIELGGDPKNPINTSLSPANVSSSPTYKASTTSLISESSVFFILYALTATYFAGVMVRLMLVLTPLVCIVSAISVSKIFTVYLQDYGHTMELDRSTSLDSPISPNRPPDALASPFTGTKITAFNRLLLVTTIVLFIFQFIRHCTWVTTTAYSSPSVVLSSYDSSGNPLLIDDFREAYYWIRKNAPPDSKVLAWWDYGYQIAGFCDTPEKPIVTLVDNNTWNNTHIATIGKILGSNEADALPLLRQLDVNFLLVLCGVVSGFAGDDMNKFLWMIRIAQGVFPQNLSESSFYNERGQFAVGNEASQTLKESLLFKMTYYNLGGVTTRDRARGGTDLEGMQVKLNILEEVFSTENYIVRIYKVKNDDPLGRARV